MGDHQRISRSLGYSSTSPLYAELHARASDLSINRMPHNKEIHSTFIKTVTLTRIISRLQNDFRTAFGIRYSAVESDYDMGFAMIVQIDPESSATEQDVLVNDIVCLINGQPLEKDITTDLINNRQIFNRQVKIGVMRLNPFRLLEEQNDDYVRHLRNVQRRHRVTLKRRQLLSRYPYGFVTKTINAADDAYDAEYFTLVFRVTQQTMLTDRSNMYVGDILATVEGLDVSAYMEDGIDLSTLIENVGKPRTLHVEFIPSSCLREFSVTVDFINGDIDRIRQPLLLQASSSQWISSQYVSNIFQDSRTI